MNTPSLTQGVRSNFDTGPLSWVMGEIREALTRSRTTIRDAVGQDSESQSTALRQAKAFLHQAHGAFQIIDVDGVASITETIEDLLARLEGGRLELNHAIAEAIESACQALTEYLEDLLSGAPHQPVRLFPYLRSLVEARGEGKTHPSDLFFPNLSIRPQLPLTAASSNINHAGLRQRYEKALLPYLKSADSKSELASASIMGEVIGEVERIQTTQQARAFWWVMRGFAEAVSSGGVTGELYVKQLFARINLQLRRLGEENAALDERLLRDALFFIAAAKNPSQRLQQIRATYQLDEQVPADYEHKRYGKIDSAALSAAKERLDQAKNLWNRIAGGDASAAGAFEQEIQSLSEAGAKLGSAALTKLLAELKGIAHRAAQLQPGHDLGLEVATALLFVENALNHSTRLADDFSERANEMTARLLALVAGKQPVQAAQWLDEMSREAQQRQTLMVLSGEMKSSLGQVEKMLDEFFNNPSKRSILEPIDPILHQIAGALAVLDQDEAIQAIEHTRAEVKRFAEAESDTVPKRSEFEHVAQNIGALSFFFETLQLNLKGVKKRFSFNPATGVFQADILHREAAADANTEVKVDLLPEQQVAAPAKETLHSPLPQLEQAAAAEAPVDSNTDWNISLSLDSGESLDPAATSHIPKAHPAAESKAIPGQEVFETPAADVTEAIDLAQMEIGVFDASPTAIASQSFGMEGSFSDQSSLSIANLEPALTAPVPENDEAIDAELLEIFLGEAEEVLDCVRQTLPKLRNESHNQEHMTTLRRSFHTLKGSGRMVGLSSFGEAAWSIEQVLNLRLSEGQGGTPELYALLEYATEFLGAWITELQIQGNSTRDPAPLVGAAERVKKGEAFHVEQKDSNELSVKSADTQATSVESDPFPSESQISANEIVADLVLPQVEEMPMSDAQMAAFHLDDIHVDVQPNQSVATEIKAIEEASIPSLAAATPAQIIAFPEMPPAEQKVDDNIKRIGALEIGVPLHNIYLTETDELVRLLGHDLEEWRHEPDRQVNVLAVHAAHSLAGSSATVGFEALQEVAHALEMVLQSLSRAPVRLAESEFDMLQQSVRCMKSMLQKFALCEMPAYEPSQVQALKRLQKTIAERAGSEQSGTQSPAGAFEQAKLSDTFAASPSQAVSGDARNAIDIREETKPAQLNAVQVEEISAAEEPLFESEEVAARALAVKDELDADLLPVFLEEGKDILPEMGQLLRSWHQDPSDINHAQSLSRLLHTIKGSARMAGAMRMGQHMHDIESRIEQITRLGAPSREAIEELQGQLDAGLHLFDQLMNPEKSNSEIAGTKVAASMQPVSHEAAGLPVAKAAASDDKPSVVLKSMMPAVSPGALSAVTSSTGLAAKENAPVSAAPVPLVRVRADVLDRLVNQAGEVSISRSRVETEVDTLRQSLTELTENVARLRSQLREIEIQAESQMASQMAHSVDREFDPLEFDRFTRLQELTRMMAESVNDVASVQHNLVKTVDGATDGLTAQARLTRDLQQDLMRVRMVQFASISERLYRVTRQASKELDKRVNLDIRGGSVEMDRSVLEKMAGPFEHLLRNAIVHGIESREARIAAGKSEVGELLVEIRQQGNEVLIQFSDDGQGLDLPRIREKAKSTGLLTDEMAVPDAEVIDLIFHPGFSTAQEVTELAGRGVGMDVVRSEAASLGGRVSIINDPGKGARFLIQLPLTLAVTQVVLLSTGGKTYAVPSALVEQVQQLKANALAAAYNEGAVIWKDSRVNLHYLSALLGDAAVAPLAQQYSPIVILKSGNERVAIHVDAVVGNREVVVKNIGPQLARMIGIAGATVLGSGDIVLIIDPVPLAHRANQDNVRAPRILPSDAPNDMGAVAEMAAKAPAVPVFQPVQGLRTQHIVMVVDDSLTVRRVTQRFLVREGYQVVLAKDGVDALEQLQAITPDVMLVDIEMPRMDGFDLTRNIRDDERTRHIPIIMITSRTATKHRNYAMELGVNEYLGKPYQESELLRLVSGYVNKDSVSAG